MQLWFDEEVLFRQTAIRCDVTGTCLGIIGTTGLLGCLCAGLIFQYHSNGGSSGSGDDDAAAAAAAADHDRDHDHDHDDVDDDGVVMVMVKVVVGDYYYNYGDDNDNDVVNIFILSLLTENIIIMINKHILGKDRWLRRRWWWW